MEEPRLKLSSQFLYFAMDKRKRRKRGFISLYCCCLIYFFFFLVFLVFLFNNNYIIRLVNFDAGDFVSSIGIFGRLELMGFG